MVSKYSVKKPLTVIVTAVLVGILGIISFTKMTTDLLPEMDLPYVIVMTTYPGASPEKVESSVTKPLEQTLATTSGIKNINSISSENASIVMIEFEQGTNMDSAMIEMSSKVDTAKAQFEDTVSTPTLMKINPDMLPIMVASVDVNGKDVKEISTIVNEKIIPEFEKIDGVASVEGSGIVEEQVEIKLDDDKINQLNNKVLESVDSKLADGKKQLDLASEKLKEGKALLEKESKLKTNELVEGSFAIAEGKEQLEEGLKDLPKTKEELDSKYNEILKQKELLEDLIKWQENNQIPVVDQERETLATLTDGLNKIKEGLSAIEEQQPALEDKLNEIVSAQKQLEVAKLTLNRELTKAEITISDKEAELEKAYKEFESSRDEAYKAAGIKEVITKDMISKILTAENFNMPAGYIKSGEDKIVVKVGDVFSSKDEISNLLLVNIPTENINEVYLKDVAEIKDTDNSSEIYAKINGNDGVALSFQKQSTASTTSVSKKINDTIDKLCSEDSDLHILPLQDQGVYINVVIDSVIDNLLLGGVLAIVILFIFLKDIKPTFIIAISIPVSLLFALAMMYFSGVTMNIISLAGLALGVGMLVDNSIVVIENIYRMRNEGYSMAAAAVKGAKEVSGAITASTLTTICVFLPIVFTNGLARQLFVDMGLTIAYSLVASLIIALTLVPAISSKMLNNTEEKPHNLFNKFTNAYEKLLEKALNHRAVILIFSAVLLVTSIVLSLAKGTILMPTMDSTQITMSMEMDSDTSDNDLREMSATIIDRVSEIDDVDTIGGMQQGGNMLMSSSSSNSKSISYYVLLKDDKKLTSQEVSNIIMDKTKDLNCKISVSASTMDMSALGGSGVDVVIKGDDIDKLREITKDVSEIVENTEGTMDIDNGLENSSTELRIIVDKNKAMDYGLTVAQVYQEVATILSDKKEATKLRIDSKDFPVVVANDDKDAITKDTLINHIMTGKKDNNNVDVKIGNIASVSEEPTLSSISREGQIRQMSVKASIDEDHNIGLVSNEIEEKLKSYDLPDGYSIKMGGEKESMDSTYKDLVSMVALAIVFIYAIMIAQFQSFKSPFIVLFTIPLAFTGGFLALLLTNKNLSMIAMLGFLILSGIVVNNGIVFVDYVNQLRLGGMEKREALITTGKTRIRPILMTALTTILGLSTLAMGIGMGADMIQPMAIVTIGGLAYATIMTLFVVPIMYDLMNKKPLKEVVIEDEI